MSPSRLQGWFVALACAVAMVMTPGSAALAAGDAPIKPEEIYYPINNVNIPVLQNGKTEGTLLFNFLIELVTREVRPVMVRYAPKIKAVFFDELYKFASTLQRDEKVQLE